MIRANSILIVFCITILLINTTSVHAQTALYRTLKVGDYGEDVQILQKWLNSNPNTQVAAEGPGSQGSETGYFGSLTLEAVKRYQVLFANDILYPLQLSAPTGIVGLVTLSHMQKRFESSNNVSQKSASNIAHPSLPEKPQILAVSPSHGTIGTEVRLYGKGFTTTDNIVASAFEEFHNIPSQDGTTLLIKLNGPFPQEFMKKHRDFYRDNQFGMDYEFVVRNARGISNFMPFYFEF